MKIGFVVNDVGTENAQYTTTRLAMAAHNREHEAWLLGVADLAHDPDGSVTGHARGPVVGKTYRSLTTFLADIQDSDGQDTIEVSDLDVLMLRNDPADDALDRPWAQTSGVLFGQLAAAAGVIVLNDPVHLADAINKTYFQHFPEEVRPRTLISRDEDDIKEFIADQGGRAVLKPLQGSGGQGVFVVGGDESINVNQIIETITRDGFVVAQEYLEEAEAGDVRMFVMNGDPLQIDGKYAAFRRVNESGDPRSNMHAGGKAKSVKVEGNMLELVEIVRPKLINDGMFLVGLDVVGSKLMEVNVFSPGGIGSAGSLHEVDYAVPIIEALERKLMLKESYGSALTNVALATL
ncbi:MAG TPA: glutathione synthetase [Acidimicrobiia bacterium]|nr:glutathione synthetase [Acidimicrobiia bacterium]